MSEHVAPTPAPDRRMYARTVALFVLGLLYVFLIPPFEGPDEPCHFARAHGAAEGQLVLKDNSGALLRFIHEIMKPRHADNPLLLNIERLLDEHEGRAPNVAWNTALYSPVPYLLHAAVIKVVAAVDPSSRGLLIALYLCRVGSLCLFIGLIFLASRIHPESSWILFWIAGAPMVLAQASIVTIDGMIFGAAALLTALALSPGSAGPRRFTAGLVLASFLLMMAKPTYLPLLFIPGAVAWANRGDSRGPGAAPFLLALAVSLAGFLVWSLIASAHDIFQSMAEGMIRFFGVELDPASQLKAILRSPAEFLRIALHSLFAGRAAIGRQIVGVLGWLNAPIPDILVIAWWALSIPAIVISDPAAAPGRGGRWIPALAFFAGALGVVLCIYISGFMMWTPVGGAFIFAQGRYFHPVVLTLFIGIALAKPALVDDRCKRYAGPGLLVLAVAINLAVLFSTCVNM